jgi:lipopolysaccharide transport system ATP-binding protein
MHSELATSNPTPVTHSDEVLVRVEGVSKKFCRSLKKSLWYGVCDIAGELSPFGRRPRIAEVTGHRPAGPAVTSHESLVTSQNQGAEGGSILPATSHQLPATSSALRDGEFWAVNDVSFELRRGECLGLIGHNGAGTQAVTFSARETAASSPKGATSGSEQVNTTLLKMLNGLIKPDSGIQAAVCDAARKTAAGSPRVRRPGRESTSRCGDGWGR